MAITITKPAVNISERLSNLDGISLENFKAMNPTFTGELRISHDYLNPQDKASVNLFSYDSSRVLTIGSRFDEEYDPTTNSDGYLYAPKGTKVDIYGRNETQNIVAGNLINFTAWNTVDAIDRANSAYIGIVANSTPVVNGPANLVFGRRVSTSIWEETMRIDVDGNVGIGTDAPNVDATVSIDHPNHGVLLGYRDSYPTSGGGLFSTSGVPASYPFDAYGHLILATRTDFGGVYDIIFTTAAVNNTPVERMVIKPSGDVGIGTTSPNSYTDYTTLTINGTNGGLLDFETNGTFVGEVFADSTNGLGLQAIGSTYIRFLTNSDERMRIDASGNLLVGKTANDNTTQGGSIRAGESSFVSGDSRALTIVRNTNDGDLAQFRQAGTTVGSIGTLLDGLHIGSTGGTDAYIGFTNSIVYPSTSAGVGRDAAIDLGTSDHRFKDLYLSGDIFVGNGTSAIDANKVYIQDSASTESARVTVVGNNAAGGALFLGGRSDTGGSTVLIRPDGDLENANNSYGAISDQRLKQDIVDAASQWDDIKAMKVRKYRFKSDPEAALQIGLVAQELEESSPGLVKNTDDDINYGDIEGPIKTVKYSLVYMKAVKALQEAMDRIETLEAKVAQLEGSN